MIRHVVCISHIDPEVHEWYKQEATRRSQEAGKRVAFAYIVGEALLAFKEKRENKVAEVIHG